LTISTGIINMICSGEPRNLTKCHAKFPEFFRGELWSRSTMSDQQ